jgi:hypothetical protein
VRDLTIFNKGKASQNAALLATSGTTETVVSNVTMESYGGGASTTGIYLQGTETRVTLVEVMAVAQDGVQACRALWNDEGASAVVYGGTYSARGATCNPVAVVNSGLGTELHAHGVSVLAEGGDSTVVALKNREGVAVLRGGSFVARGPDAIGIVNGEEAARLEAEGVTALAANLGEADEAIGLSNVNAAGATLRGGSYTGRGRDSSYGIYNGGGTLFASGVVGLGEGASGGCVGLLMAGDASSEILNSTFLGNGGSSAMGVRIYSGTLAAHAIYARGEAGSTNYGVYSSGGSSLITQTRLEGTSSCVSGSAGVISVTNSILIGGGASSSVDCLLVVRGTNVSADVPPYTCP